MRKSIPYIKNATPLQGFQLFVEFEDGVSGVVDLSGFKGKGVFECWNNEENFKKVKITGAKKVEWSEVIDMDPDSFYLKLVGMSFFEYADS